MRKDNSEVSLTVVRRLPRYYRFLCGLKSSGVQRISSREIARQMGLTASQIRQDLNCFGGFGQQGYGYNVDQLSEEIENILYLNEELSAIIIGAGNLGRALANLLTYEGRGIRLIGMFDKNPRAVTDLYPELEVMSITALESFCEQHHPRVAILCIPAESAQTMADRLMNLNIAGFWNFSHVDLRVKKGVKVENVHLGNSLMTLDYMVNANVEGV